MLSVVAYVTREETARHVRAALGRSTEFLVVDHINLVTTAVEARAASVVVAEVASAQGTPLSLALQAGPGTKIQVPVVALVRPCKEDMRLIAPTIRAGAADIAVLSIDDLAKTCREASVKEETELTGPLLQVAANVLSGPALNALRKCVSMRHGRANANEIAAAVGFSEKSIARAFAALGLPRPGCTLRWLRVLQALERLGRGATLRSVAASLGYSSAAALRRAILDVTGLEPREARRAQNRTVALARFEQTLRSSLASRQSSHPESGELPRGRVSATLAS